MNYDAALIIIQLKRADKCLILIKWSILSGGETMSEKHKKHSLIQTIATIIVDKRRLVFLFYVFALIFCVFSVKWVEVENDVTQYLPKDTETRMGIEAMNDNFQAYGMAQIMVSNITMDEAENLRAMMEDVDGVVMVTFDDSADHYRDAAALYDVTFSAAATDPICLNGMEEIGENLEGYDAEIDTLIGYDETQMLAEEMTTILIVAVIIIIAVLILTSRSYAEVPVLLLTFGAAAVLNMGTNFIFRKISFISNSVAVVLQLALAIDYAIILCHRFSDENETKDAREACISALTKSIPEISASSLTTISGLVALSFMKFAIGFDLSMVLIKSVLLSMLSVFTLMPGLLMLFRNLIRRTKHKRLLPNITPVGRFAVKTRYIMPAIFAVVFIGAFFLANQCPYCYSYNEVKTAKMADRQVAHFEIQDTFGTNNMVALMVPSGNYEAERAILSELESRPEIKSTMALANTEAMDGYLLSDALTPRQFSELIGLDYEVAGALYSAYAVDQNQYGELLQGLQEYEVPLFDMFVFLKDQLETRNITLTGDGMEGLDGMFDQLDQAQNQLQNENYSRMVVYLNLPEEGQETFDFLQEMRNIMGRYYDSDYYVVGNSTSARDLSESFASDNMLISVLSALFVIAVLLITFRSAGLPVLLIMVIQGSIWINFSFPALMHQPLYFLGYLIVNAIQMGANIDYAIVISSHYQELKNQMSHKKAIVQALNESFPTIFTSGTIMASAALLIGNLSTQPVVSIMGNCLGRGTIISIILVFGVLPAILVLGDSVIEHTKFNIQPAPCQEQEVSGKVRVKGRVRGYISGMVDADIDGVLHGDMNASVLLGGEVEKDEGGEDNA